MFKRVCWFRQRKGGGRTRERVFHNETKGHILIYSAIFMQEESHSVSFCAFQREGAAIHVYECVRDPPTAG